MPDRSKKKYLRISVRVMFVLVAAACVAAALIAQQRARVARQQEAVRTLERTGFHIYYDYHFGDDQDGYPDENASPPNLSVFTRLTGFGTPKVIRADLVRRPPSDSRKFLEAFKHLRTVRSITINSVTDGDLAFLRYPKSLRGLTITGDGITDVGLAMVGDLSDLDWLSVSSNSVTDAGVEHLAKLDKLKTLLLYEANVSEQGLRELGQMKSLEHLQIDGTEVVTAAGIAGLSSAPKLRRLELTHTKLDANAVEALSKLESLEVLSLSFSQIPEGSALKLQNSRADLRVTADEIESDDLKGWNPFTGTYD